MEVKKNHKSFLPIINRGTWSRVFAIENNIEKILSAMDECNNQIHVNIINFGCGFDTMYFNLKQKFNNFKYFEFDYPEITSKKIKLIKRSNLLNNFITIGNKSLSIETDKLKNDLQNENFRLTTNTRDYFLIDCDIINIEKINEEFCKIPEFDYSVPTIVICECLLVYMKKDISINILQNLTNNFKNIILIEYDLIGSDDNFGKEMITNLLNRDIKLNGFEEVPDIKSQLERLLKSGFKTCQVLDMLEYYNKYIDSTEKRRIEKLELVDEYEEWNLLQMHSCFGYGTKLEDKFEFLNDVLELKKK
jgi:tRNA wybutosine-synthesizing protein 4